MTDDGNRMTKPLTIAQRIFRAWCKDSGVIVDALAAGDLVRKITAAIEAERQP